MSRASGHLRYILGAAVFCCVALLLGCSSIEEEKNFASIEEEKLHSSLDQEAIWQAASLALFVGDIERVKRLARDLDDIDKRVNGSTLLIDAVWFQQKEIVEFLLQEGANVNAKDTYFGRSLLGIAYANGNEEIMGMLVRNGADVAAIQEKNALTAGQNEIVMQPGMEISATTEIGPISITAETELKRVYSWEGATRWVVMDPRRKRWYGSLGLVFPGMGRHWKAHNGIARAVIDEGQQHFGNLEKAMDWIRSRKQMSFVYRDDGLMVGWGKELSREQLNAAVWQILIQGKKPQALPGSQNDKISVTLPEHVSLPTVPGES